MGHEKSSYDWLPAGWKVQVRVRKTGKKDKVQQIGALMILLVCCNS